MLFLKLLTAHLLGDYIFQTDRVASGKQRLRYMVLHALAHGTLLTLVGFTEAATTGLWMVLFMILIAHVTIDAWTSRRAQRDWKLLLLDQSLHVFGAEHQVGSQGGENRQGGRGRPQDRLQLVSA